VQTATGNIKRTCTRGRSAKYAHRFRVRRIECTCKNCLVNGHSIVRCIFKEVHNFG
jgi:hypothetical protein